MTKDWYGLLRANAPEGDLARILGRVLVDPANYVVPRGRVLLPWADVQAAGYTYFGADTNKENYRIELISDLRAAITSNRTYIALDPATVDLLTVANQVRRLTGQMNRVIRYLEANFDRSEPT